MSDGPVKARGRFLGRLIYEPLPDGRRMQLVEPFGFIDERAKAWSVPIGAKVDGASIPQALWSFVGGPFEGKYRDASVIHDYYCDVRLEPWRAVHCMFYDAMLVSGVSESRAKVMYAAVYFGGPRWSDTAVENAKLTHVQARLSDGGTRFKDGILNAVEIIGDSPATRSRHPGVSRTDTQQAQLDLRMLERLIEENAPSLAEIDDAMNEVIDLTDPKDAEAKPVRVVVLTP